MRPLAAISIALVSAAASVAACGKSGNQSPAAAIDDGVCDALFNAMVAIWAKCAAQPVLGPPQGVPNAVPFGTALVGPMQEDIFVDYYCHVLPAAPGTGPLADQLSACTTALQNASSCEATADPACTFSGTLSPGSACGSWAQCASGACGQVGWSGAAAPASSDEACGTCLAAVSDGTTCIGPGMNVTCDPGSSCGAAFTPDGGSGTVCTPYTQAGASCAMCSPQPCSPPMCAPGLMCDVSTQTCEPTPLLPAQGQSCNEMVQGGCAPGLMCGNAASSDADAGPPAVVCVEALAVGQGQPCTTGTPEIACNVGLQCQQGICQPLLTVGAPCMPHDGQCAYPLVCNAGTCQQPDPAGCGSQSATLR